MTRFHRPPNHESRTNNLKITDECPGCGTNHLDLYPDAFTSLGPLSAGILSVTWDYVECPITTPLQVHLKEGVSANWFSMQVVNAAEGISKLEVSTDSGSTWKPTTRTDYNYFEHSSGYGSTVDVKVTGLSGATVIVKKIAVTPGNLVTASANVDSGSNSTPTSTKKELIAASSSPVAEPSTTSSVAAVVTPASSSVVEASTSAAVATPSSSAPAEVPTASIVWVDGDECEE